MNIVTANRLLDLRKEKNLSQEALAEKLGISRQAISKWERAEASPDTDNLIALAKLYGMSLDDLLGIEQSALVKSDAPEASEEEAQEPDDYVHVGTGGIHVKDKDSEVHVGWGGIHVNDKTTNEKVDIGKEGVYINDEKYDWDEWLHHPQGRKAIMTFPFPILVTIAYLMVGIFLNAWHPGWILFLLIPLWYTMIEAIYKKNANVFAYPVVVVIVFLLLGFYKGAWNPAWILFLSIPIYYSIVNYVRIRNKKN